ncbi:MAG TPA: hypothetical protein VG308_07000 [Stellaceae bacterium]|nr:hypothetical protein [Stellaceae bacterium]
MDKVGMEKSGKRGKIPQSDWPLIMARYEQGETLSSIARTYDCSPPAISYIVSRSRGKSAADASAPSPQEMQLVKAPAADAAANGSALLEPQVEPPAALLRHEPAADARPLAAPNSAEANGEPRRKLHLSLGNGSGHGNGVRNGNGAGTDGGNGLLRTNGNGNGHSLEPAARPGIAVPQAPMAADRDLPQSNGRDLYPISEGRPGAQQPRDSDAARNGAFIGQELRSRVDGDIAAFLAAFDAALAADTQESRFGLREATDRLLRAGARTRIELERLEAKMPLASRDGVAAPEPAWRYR